MALYCLLHTVQTRWLISDDSLAFQSYFVVLVQMAHILHHSRMLTLFEMTIALSHLCVIPNMASLVLICLPSPPPTSVGPNQWKVSETSLLSLHLPKLPGLEEKFSTR